MLDERTSHSWESPSKKLLMSRSTPVHFSLRVRVECTTLDAASPWPEPLRKPKKIRSYMAFNTSTVHAGRFLSSTCDSERSLPPSPSDIHPTPRLLSVAPSLQPFGRPEDSSPVPRRSGRPSPPSKQKRERLPSITRSKPCAAFPV